MTTKQKPVATKITDVFLLLFVIATLGLLARAMLAPEPVVIQVRPAVPDPGIPLPEAAPELPAASCCRGGCKLPKKCINCVCTLPATLPTGKDLGVGHYLIWDYAPLRPGEFPADPTCDPSP